MDTRSLVTRSLSMDLGRMAFERHPLLWSAVASTVLFAAVGMTADASHAYESNPGLSVAVSGVVYLVMIAVRRFPVTAAAVAAIGSVIEMANGMRYPVTLPAVFVTLYVVALTTGNLRTVLTGIPIKAALLTAGLVIYPGFTGFTILLWAALAVALGKAVRSHRAYVAEVEDRARRAEQAKEDEANRRVAEERVRIARELHDVIGHHVALISVQAGALSCLLAPDQAEARESVTHIQQASADALDDLRLTVGLLREPGAGEPEEPPQPVAGLGGLDELICSFASTGLRVTQEVTGQQRPLPEPVSLTAYRVIQESLTNTRKHAATGSALVRLGYTPGTLRVAVEDAGSPRPPAGGPGRAQQGHGIIGMRERVTALGGQLSAGPRPEGGFRVVAELPLTGAGS